MEIIYDYQQQTKKQWTIHIILFTSVQFQDKTMGPSQ